MIIYDDKNKILYIPEPEDSVIMEWSDFFEKGKKDGYKDGYESGYTEGYADGYAVGYDECHHDYSKDYLTIEALEDGRLYVNKGSFYSINGGEWLSSFGGFRLDLHEGDKVRFKGGPFMQVDGTGMFSGRTNINTTAIAAYGNILSLWYGDDFSGQTSCLATQNMFKQNTGIVDASNLVLPATEITQSYKGMFVGCTSLTTAPELPGTTLAEGGGYAGMFGGCTSLSTAPELPATKLVEGCYQGMFQDCTSLTTAPSLPATELEVSCYYLMFSGCTSLTTAPELPATTLEQNCYDFMFRGCTSLTTAPALPATTLAEGCYMNMFGGCTGLTSAPALPSTTLADRCYYGMFSGCTSLTTAPELPAPILVPGCYGLMFQKCSSLNYIKCLATYMPETESVFDESTWFWVDGVAPFGDFIREHGSTWTRGESGIPSGWRVADNHF